MPSYRGKLVKIEWGEALANTCYLGYPLDDTLAYSGPREGSEWVQGSSGVEDGWTEGTDHYLSGAARWIPRDTGASPYGVATGWDGATGVRALLDWWRIGGNAARVYLDAAAPASARLFYLVEPREGRPQAERDYTRRVDLVLRAQDGLPVDGF